MMSIKEILFFAVIFLTIVVSSGSADLLHEKFNANKWLVLCCLALAATGVLAFVYKLARIAQSQKDSFTFKVTPEKLCHGGPYMYSSAPKELQDYCNSLTQQQYDQYNCRPGFSGMPKDMQRTPMSDSKWENHMCEGVNPMTPDVF